jgi:hypothetical protein
LLAYLSAVLVNQLIGQAAKLLDERCQQIGEPKQEPSSLLLKSGRRANLAWMVVLSDAQLAMAVPTRDDGLIPKRSPSDVMKLEAMRIGLTANSASWLVGSQTLQGLLTHTLRIIVGHGNHLSFNELRDKAVDLLKSLAPG